MNDRPRRAGERRSAILVLLASLVASLVAFRAGPAWLQGAVGNYDAWQGLWNLQHVERFLGGETPLWFSDRLWAPEGTTLLFHALSPGLTVPGALLARLTNPFIAYNGLVLACFSLSAVALFRLARRTGASTLGAVAGALCFAFAPVYTARVSAGHLNLLGIWSIPFALDGLLMASREKGRAKFLGAVVAGLSMAFVCYIDFYLAFLCALALSVTGLFELSPRRGADLRNTAWTFLAAALVSVTLASPLLVRLAAEGRHVRVEGHAPRRLSVDAAALLVAGRTQLVNRLLNGLPGPPVPPEVENNAYLGLLPLAALLRALFTRPSRFLIAVATASGIALVLSLGPVLQFAGRDTGIPLPYQGLQALVPSLAIGGGVNRLLLLVPLALSLGVAGTVTEMMSKGSKRRLSCFALCAVALLVEYAPAHPGLSSFPYVPPDPAMVAIANSTESGFVVDLDAGLPGIFRQLRHGRPQVFGYMSRAPLASVEKRRRDPLLGERAAPFGFPVLARSGLSFAFRVPDDTLPRLSDLSLSTSDKAELEKGIRLESFSEPVGSGRWVFTRAEIFFPAQAGTWDLFIEELKPETAKLILTWGEKRPRQREYALAAGHTSVPFSVEDEDLTQKGGLRLRLEVLGAGRAEAGILVASLAKR